LLELLKLVFEKLENPLSSFKKNYPLSYLKRG